MQTAQKDNLDKTFTPFDKSHKTHSIIQKTDLISMVILFRIQNHFSFYNIYIHTHTRTNREDVRGLVNGNKYKKSMFKFEKM